MQARISWFDEPYPLVVSIWSAAIIWHQYAEMAAHVAQREQHSMKQKCKHWCKASGNVELVAGLPLVTDMVLHSIKAGVLILGPLCVLNGEVWWKTMGLKPGCKYLQRAKQNQLCSMYCNSSWRERSPYLLPTRVQSFSLVSDWELFCWLHLFKRDILRAC